MRMNGKTRNLGWVVLAGGLGLAVAGGGCEDDADVDGVSVATKGDGGVDAPMACFDAAPGAPAADMAAADTTPVDPLVTAMAESLAAGRQSFRSDTFGSEAFWGDTLKLHTTIAGAANGGVGPGLSPKAALGIGLKVDAEALPATLVASIKAGQVNLDDPATTLALLQLNAVVGVTGFFNPDKTIKSIGIQCALCHSTVDDSFSPGIGKRLDGWANRDLNVGAVISFAPDLTAFTTLLGVDLATLKTVLAAWGPGKFDAALALDGKALRPDGKPGATLIPPAFGLAGQSLHTWTGWGSISHWNAFVANLEMMGKGTLYDPRLNDAAKFPIAARNMFGNVRKDARPDHGQAGGPADLPAGAEAPRAAGRFVRHDGQRSAAGICSAARPNAPPATCRRCSPNPAGRCTPPRRSASTTSSRPAHPTTATGPPRCAACTATPRAASITTAASPR